MNPDAIQSAAKILWDAWKERRTIAQLPTDCRPLTRVDAYTIQEAVVEHAGDATFGWKIAATSTAGQAHIGVDGPLAGRLLKRTVLRSSGGGAEAVSLAGNTMLVSEAEFAFRLGRDLPPRAEEYSVDEVMAAVTALYPAIEIPDSRFEDFVAVGAEQLIADNACACAFVLGPESPEVWRQIDLAAHPASMAKSGETVAEGGGANVLGDPRVALTWLVNELARFAGGVRAGEVVTTGTCVAPVKIASGDMLRADFGELGTVDVQLVG